MMTRIITFEQERAAGNARPRRYGSVYPFQLMVLFLDSRNGIFGRAVGRVRLTEGGPDHRRSRYPTIVEAITIQESKNSVPATDRLPALLEQK